MFTTHIFIVFSKSSILSILGFINTKWIGVTAERSLDYSFQVVHSRSWTVQLADDNQVDISKPRRFYVTSYFIPSQNSTEYLLYKISIR